MGAFARYIRAGCSLDLCIPTSLSCLVFQSQQLSRVYSSGDGLALEAWFVDLSTSVLRFEKFAQKCFCFAAAILRAFFLHALSAFMLLHGCRSESHLCLLGSSDAARCFSLSISRPTHPVALASGFLAVPAFLFDTANLEFTLHSRACHFCRSALALLFHQPVVWAAALLLHFACSAAPAVRCTSCQNGCSTTILLSRSSGPSA